MMNSATTSASDRSRQTTNTHMNRAVEGGYLKWSIMAWSNGLYIGVMRRLEQRDVIAGAMPP